MQDKTIRIRHNDDPPCKAACPILTDVREYVQLIAERRYEEAFASIRKLNPLPGVCGRICTHPCEAACKRGQVDEPIAIAALKRFACDGPWKDQYKETLPAKQTGHKVAVVGSGPAGLAAAHDLALLGHDVTILEALPNLGGMLRVGVPAYRLPKDVLDEEIRAILDLGIEAKTGVRLGEDIQLAELFEQGYEAVFLAIGAHKDRKLGIPGENELVGVVSAVSFLRQVNQGENPEVGEKVAVIGGGNTAVDSARSARRLGAKEVHMVYRRSSDEMPAAAEEIEDAIEEGIQISYLTSPLEILGTDGRVSSLNCIKNELGEPDAGGRRWPKPVEGSEFSTDVDMVIAAIGQAPESSSVDGELEVSEKGNRIHVEDASLVTNKAGVFAGGDAVTGPATAVKAIAAGKRAAMSIDLYLRGKALPESIPVKEDETQELPEGVVQKTPTSPRCTIQTLPLDDRLAAFDEVALGLTGEQAVLEAQRCLHCNLGATVDEERCIGCGTCVEACPLEIPSMGQDGRLDLDLFQCQACGTCVAECPVQAVNARFYPHRWVVSEVHKIVGDLQVTNHFIVGLFSQYGNFNQGHLDALGQAFPQIVRVPVFGLERVSLSDMIQLFQLGADAVLIGKASPENNRFSGAWPLVEKRCEAVREILDLLGYGGDRLILYTMPQEGLFEAGWLDETMEKISTLRPNPLRRQAIAA
jgi:NADPH-dependent glutamate synthase beta subunit-like oxidoreductase/coenzyme F420-reducing hydrogenase delta subunit